MISDVGGRPLRFPVLAIEAPSDPGPLLRAIAALDAYDIAIFISQNAVQRTLECLRGRRDLPTGLQIAAIGQSTARALTRSGVTVHICPQHRFDSEAMLALPALQELAGMRIVIFRGEGGRELLADTLRERGAQVSHVESYRRALPRANPAALMEQWADGAIDVVTSTSSEALQNLCQLVGERGWHYLRATPLVVLSGRTAALARRLGFGREVLVADEASDEGLLGALLHWFGAAANTQEDPRMAEATAARGRSKT